MADLEALPEARKPRVDSWWGDIGVVLVAVPTSLWLDQYVRPIFHGRIASSSSDVYGALLGLHGTLLGFVLAALTIVLGYLNRPQFASLRAAKQGPNLARIYMASIRTHSIGVLLALLGVVYESGGRFQAFLTWGTLFVAVLASVRLMRVLWATSQIVKYV